jgi:predicted glycogen debranching enzyme
MQLHESQTINRMPWAKDNPVEQSALLTREWLVTNGLGGYASGTVAGACTRRFHGLLVAALPAPLGRLMMLNHISEELRLPDGRLIALGADEQADGELHVHGAQVLVEFRLERGLPVWRYDFDGIVLEKSIVLPHLQNTVFARYKLLSSPGPVRLRVRPSLHFRAHEGRVDEALPFPYRVVSLSARHEIRGEDALPPLRLRVYGDKASLVLDGGCFRELFYRVEHSRGYDARGRLWSPGYLRAEIAPGSEAAIGGSTEPWEMFSAIDPADAFENEQARRHRLVAIAHPAVRGAPANEWIIAADQCIVTPNTRVVDAARVRAEGDDIRTIIAGYPWFTDWGRDTMISLEGLTLVTGRHHEAGYILRMFARHVRDGLIPNLFPEGGSEGLYHTADATLWFFHAAGRYLDYTGDEDTLSRLMPVFTDIVDAHLGGTRFGIGVDREDGLLRQGAEGYQLTWMDAKVGDWVVTPRRGKAVEINALWYNALRLMEAWEGRFKRPEEARRYGRLADRARASFNEKFWDAELGFLRDVIDGPDAADARRLRPNQVFAVSLPYPILVQERWAAVVEVLRAELLTPVGLRTLCPKEPDYKKRYDGDLRSRDAAYHQGTVWAWLLGAYVDALLRVRPEDKAGARRLLEPLLDHLREACLGSISEIFDAEPPFTPRGCVAQAWSVAEALRAWVKTA